MNQDDFAKRLEALFPDFDTFAFGDWWITPQPLLGGRAPSEVPINEVENLISAVEAFHAGKK